jgi:hypothetical protein
MPEPSFNEFHPSPDLVNGSGELLLNFFAVAARVDAAFDSLDRFVYELAQTEHGVCREISRGRIRNRTEGTYHVRQVARKRAEMPLEPKFLHSCFNFDQKRRGRHVINVTRKCGHAAGRWP